jgi:crotonobetainyl-CoA:carnitine CoA-transferase CaiB-like acyl-CoA transferase
LDVAEAIEDENLKERKAFVELDHVHAGKVKVLAPWIRFSETPGAVHSAAPLKGQHNQEIFRNLLGMSSEDIERLTREGVIGAPEDIQTRTSKPLSTAK